QVGDRGGAEEGRDLVGDPLPPMVRGAGVRVVALLAAEQAGPPGLDRVETLDDLVEGKLICRNGEGEAAPRSSHGAEDAGACELMQRLGQVVTRYAERLGHGLDTDHLIVVCDVEDGA